MTGAGAILIGFSILMWLWMVVYLLSGEIANLFALLRSRIRSRRARRR